MEKNNNRVLGTTKTTPFGMSTNNKINNNTAKLASHTEGASRTGGALRTEDASRIESASRIKIIKNKKFA